MFFSAYGLRFKSDLDLPELNAADHVDLAASHDVEILKAPVSPNGLEGGAPLGPYLWANSESLWLHIPHVARFLVTGGHRITVDPEPGIDEESIRVFLLGSAMGALLFQRGYLVLHGNAIRIGHQCMICVGHSGAGKSTLAAAFLQRGYEILADDVVPIDSECRALPGFPRIKLWQDTADKLGIDTQGLRRIRPDLEKFNFPMAVGTEEPLPVRWVYILGSHHNPETLFEPIRGLDRFTPLRNNSYRVRYMDGMALKKDHLKLCGKLAGRIHLTRITRPEQGFELDGLVDRILSDIQANP